MLKLAFGEKRSLRYRVLLPFPVNVGGINGNTNNTQLLDLPVGSRLTGSCEFGGDTKAVLQQLQRNSDKLCKIF